jgi:hypothetical protein
MTIDISEFCLLTLSVTTAVVSLTFMLLVTYWLSVDNDL